MCLQKGANGIANRVIIIYDYYKSVFHLITA